MAYKVLPVLGISSPVFKVLKKNQMPWKSWIISNVFSSKEHGWWIRMLVSCSSAWGQESMLFVALHPMMVGGNHWWEIPHDWKESRNIHPPNVLVSSFKVIQTGNSRKNIIIKDLKSKVSEEIGSTWLLEGNSNFQAQINGFPAWENGLWTMKNRFRCLRSWRSLKNWEIANTFCHFLLPRKSIQSYIHLGQGYTVE